MSKTSLIQTLKSLTECKSDLGFGFIERGVEKESLRIDNEGQISLAPHPVALGSALTHPKITTDFSEAQLELITGVHTSPEDLIDELTLIHQGIVQNIGDELLLATSFPAKLPSSEKIPIANYGSSNSGRLKRAYRNGLSNRYGSVMQTVSGIHYNFSLSDSFWKILQDVEGNKEPFQAYKTEKYFGLARNFKRNSWLMLYLLGSSPALDASFVSPFTQNMQQWQDRTWHLPYATALRMGNAGYQSVAQAKVNVSFNSIQAYSRTMNRALTLKEESYAKIGIQGKDGRFHQLSDGLIQIENEYYGLIRPKPRTSGSERPLRALNKHGVRYLELRFLDLNPFIATGLDAHTIKGIDVFLLYCLLSPSPLEEDKEIEWQTENKIKVVEQGRLPNSSLRTSSGDMPLIQWARQLLKEQKIIADFLDEIFAESGFSSAIDNFSAILKHPEHSPSQRQLTWMQENKAEFLDFGLEFSRQNHAYFKSLPWGQKTKSSISGDM